MNYVRNGTRIECEKSDCRETVGNNQYAKKRASDWFFSREQDAAWCPKHVPAWVALWRARRKS